MLVAPCHCSGYFKVPVHAKFFQSPYMLYDTLSPPNIWICCKNHVLLKHPDTHPGISCGSILVFSWCPPYNVIIRCTFTMYRTLKQRKMKTRPSTKILNPIIVENIVVVSVTGYWHQVRSYGSKNMAVSVLFSRLTEFDPAGCEGAKLDYTPLSDVNMVWTYPGHGPQTMGNTDPFELKYSTSTCLFHVAFVCFVTQCSFLKE